MKGEAKGQSQRFEDVKLLDLKMEEGVMSQGMCVASRS